jgi:hypothetical protein
MVALGDAPFHNARRGGGCTPASPLPATPFMEAVMGNIKDITEQRFGHLIAVKILPGRTSGGGTIWLCQCKCGNTTSVARGNLKSKSIISCGCWRREKTLKHGHRRRNLAPHPLYGTWKGMHMRCNNPRHKDWQWYGARGVKVCKRWKDFALFLADVGKRPRGRSLDRINYNGNYTPKNVRWATPLQQVRNRRPR